MRERSILAGLIGRDIKNSMSPLLHEEEAAALGLRLVYRLVDFKDLSLAESDLAATIAHAWHLGYDGLNVTHPYKMSVLPLLDEFSIEAEAIGAVNTIVFEGGRRTGHNTDWSGFSQGMRWGLPGAKLDCVTVIGAGGAGSATSYAALSLGAKRLLIHDINMIRAERLATKLQALFPDKSVVSEQSIEEAIARADGLIQTSPIGMIDNPGVSFSPSMLRPAMWITDIIYPPGETELLAAARALGCRTLNGEAMIAFQAAGALALIAKVKPDSDRMLRSLRGSNCGQHESATTQRTSR